MKYGSACIVHTNQIKCYRIIPYIVACAYICTSAVSSLSASSLIFSTSLLVLSLMRGSIYGVGWGHGGWGEVV